MMLQTEIIAKRYPNMLEISIIIFPSPSHPKIPAIELDIIKVSLYNEIDTIVGSIVSASIIMKIMPTFERKYSILAPTVFNDSPTVPPAKGMI